MNKSVRSDPKFAPVKLGWLFKKRNQASLVHNVAFILTFSVLPEHSTEIGDLIQPVPGVLYEDSKLKKGDPRRYQVNDDISFRLLSDSDLF